DTYTGSYSGNNRNSVEGALLISIPLEINYNSWKSQWTLDFWRVSSHPITESLYRLGDININTVNNDNATDNTSVLVLGIIPGVTF
ncbi:unnamed protein product, partial [Allacma fusca]